MLGVVYKYIEKASERKTNKHTSMRSREKDARRKRVYTNPHLIRHFIGGEVECEPCVHEDDLIVEAPLEPEKKKTKNKKAIHGKGMPQPPIVDDEPRAAAIHDGPKFSKKLLRDINKSLGSVERIKPKKKLSPVDKMKQNQQQQSGGRIDNISL